MAKEKLFPSIRKTYDMLRHPSNATGSENKSLLETTSNTRELGGYRTKEGAYTLYNMLIRSDEPKSLHRKDIAWLSEHHITTIIDMRCQKDIEKSPNSFRKMPQFCYYHIPIEEGSGVLFHCSAGKDRTGVVSAILLLLTGISEEDIIQNYMMTKEYNQKRFDSIRQNFPDIDMNIIIPNETYMAQFLHLFRKKYGDAESYLRSIDVSPEEIQRIPVPFI